MAILSATPVRKQNSMVVQWQSVFLYGIAEHISHVPQYHV
jgi:hypothetical protein